MIKLNHTFESFLDTAAKLHPDKHTCESVMATPAWAGPSTLEAVKLAKRGWPEGFERMSKIVASLEDALTFPTTHEVILRDVEGQAPDVDAYLRGDPECMFRIEQETRLQEKRFVNLQISLAVSVGVSAEEIYWRGAVAVALVRAIEAKGMSVAITVDLTTARKEATAIIFNAKEAGAPLDLDRLTFLLAHPGVLRRLAFSVWEHMPEPFRTTGDFRHGRGYGRPAAPKLPDMDLHFTLKDCHATDLLSAVQEFKRFNALLKTILAEKAKEAEAESW